MNTFHRVAARLVAMALLPAAFATRAQDSEALGPNAWPTTLAAAVDTALRNLSATERGALKAMKREDLIDLHHGYGTALRNYLGLWRGNTDLLVSACGRPCHPDAASAIIIEAVWKQLQQ